VRVERPPMLNDTPPLVAALSALVRQRLNGEQ
jgi:protoheme ferro-lyase